MLKTNHLLLCFLFSICIQTNAEEIVDQKSQSEELFVRRVSKLLREKCQGCHGNDPEMIEGSFDVRSLEGLAKGGDSEEASIISGKPKLSSLYLASRRDHDNWSAMPPKESEKLTEEELKWLSDWIKTGASWPTEERIKAIAKKNEEKWSAEDGIIVATSGGLADEWTNRRYEPESLWAYAPVKKVQRDVPQNKSMVDVLIEERFPKKITAASRADRRTLIRRATFDLLGLPPTPKEVQNFISDSSSDKIAFANLVERLLKSPQYGVRMAQHWLDVVRYADSSGFANDYERGNAWRYRDYVIRSFNKDKPYEQFILEQIAGDEIDPNDPELLVATGFLRMGPWELTSMEVEKVARQRFLDDVTNSVGETFLGHSLQCSRCHDHKFDPVPTRDYYSIQAVFATTQLAERKTPFLKEENTSWFDEKKYLNDLKQTHYKTIGELDQILLVNAQKWFKENGISPKKWNQVVDDAKVNKFSAARSKLKRMKISDDQIPPSNVGFTPEQFGVSRVAGKGLQRLKWEFERYQPFALSVYSGKTPTLTRVNSPLRVPKSRLKKGELENSTILTGGDPFSPGGKVEPGTLSILDQYVSADIPNEIEQRRKNFAHWVADENNPLTTRVMVNRIWQWHFGKGIAGNPNNFGSTGKRPTHPALLDWLASSFVQKDWSVKAMHRIIMNSDTYCRSDRHPDTESLKEHDPLNESYATFAPRRMSAEELRDAMLMVSGELNPTIGGIPCRPDINKEVALQPRQVMGSFAAAWVPNPEPERRNRRSLYVLKLRGLMDPMLEVFNSPGPDFSCERREASTVTPQVFTLFNSQNTYSRALSLANRATKETTNDNQAIQRCFQLVYSRSPTPLEEKEFLTHWSSIEKSIRNQSTPPIKQPLKVVRNAVEENTGERFSFEEVLHSNKDYVSDLQPSDVSTHIRALADLCLVMLNSNEFVYIY